MHSISLSAGVTLAYATQLVDDYQIVQQPPSVLIGTLLVLVLVSYACSFAAGTLQTHDASSPWRPVMEFVHTTIEQISGIINMTIGTLVVQISMWYASSTPLAFIVVVLILQFSSILSISRPKYEHTGAPVA